MKTMLGGWEDVQRLLTEERAARPGWAAPSASLSPQRCVAVAPKESATEARAARRFSLRETRVGGVSVALTRPVRQPAAPAGALGAARLAQMALDETCELRDVDFQLLLQQPVPPQPSPARHGAAGLRRGSTQIDPALRVVPPPTRRRTRSALSVLQSLVQRAKALLTGRRHSPDSRAAGARRARA